MKKLNAVLISCLCLLASCKNDSSGNLVEKEQVSDDVRVIEIESPEQLKQELAHNLPTIMKIYTPWCPACSMMEQAFNNAANKHHNALFLNLNADNQALAPVMTEYNIEALPTFVYTHPKQEKPRIELGATDEQSFAQKVEQFISSTQ